MYHSITFNTFNCYDKWHLIPTERPHIPPPSIKTKTVDIPGGNGVIDLTESLTGYPLYSNREGSFEFYVENGHQDWHVLYEELLDFFNGTERKIYLEDDPNWFYQGRVWVSDWKTDKFMSTVTLSYSVEPFKYYDKTAIQLYTGEQLGIINHLVPNDSDWDTKWFNNLNLYIGKLPIIPVMHLGSITGTSDATDTRGTIKIAFHNKELNIDFETRIVADAWQRLPMCPLSDLSGGNEMWFKIEGPCIAQIDFRKAAL